jgi:dimethylhistidine N-methyltransferase
MNLPVQQLGAADVADREQFKSAVLEGLGTRPRAIPARFLYDARGSGLFDAICELPEYYLTRTETAILARNAAEVSQLAGPQCILIEFGSGSSVKSRLLLDAMSTLEAYVPIDISREHLDGTVAGLRRDYPALRVHAVCADYMTLDRLPDTINGNRRIGFFPGSTIGNLTPEEATSFLRRVRRLLGDDGALILGVDLKKDRRRLHDAYNDAAGVTAQFTLNLLRRMNRELDATFDLAAFAHEAFYNPVESRIEIYLRSLRAQTVSVAGHRFTFEEGERIHTEYSYKYDDASLAALAGSGGFDVERSWTDPEGLFAVAWLTARL